MRVMRGPGLSRPREGDSLSGDAAPTASPRKGSLVTDPEAGEIAVPGSAPAPFPTLGNGLGNRGLAESLAGPLIEACDGQLSDLRWFRTDWQRGGAATARATWTAKSTGPGGGCEHVVVKLPVNTRELNWMRRLQRSDRLPVIPRLLASGDALDQYDLGWVVIEQLPFGPLGGHWHESHVDRIAAAIAQFSLDARAFPVDRAARQEDWERLLAAARDAVKVNRVPERQRWNAALRTASHRWHQLVATWEARAPLEWIHGDLHLANAMSRTGHDHGEVCLIDLAEVRPGHWLEDAIYLERQLWARPERLRGHQPVKAIADARRARGLENGDDTAHLGQVRRTLLAATSLAFLKSEGAPGYLGACLERLESGLKEL